MTHTGIDLSRYSYEDLLIILGVFEHELDVKEFEGGLVACWKDGGPDRVRAKAHKNASRRRAGREARA